MKTLSKSKKIQTVWKVVRIMSRNSKRSIFINSRGVELIYSTKKFIVPKIKNSQIFCFAKSIDAIRYSQQYPESQVWQAMASGVEKIRSFDIFGVMSVADAKMIWESPWDYTSKCIPHGTIGCNSLKLVKRLL